MNCSDQSEINIRVCGAMQQTGTGSVKSLFGEYLKLEGIYDHPSI